MKTPLRLGAISPSRSWPLPRRCPRTPDARSLVPRWRTARSCAGSPTVQNHRNPRTRTGANSRSSCFGAWSKKPERYRSASICLCKQGVAGVAAYRLTRRRHVLACSQLCCQGHSQRLGGRPGVAELPHRRQPWQAPMMLAKTGEGLMTARNRRQWAAYKFAIFLMLLGVVLAGSALWL